MRLPIVFFACLLCPCTLLADEVLLDSMSTTSPWTLTGDHVNYVLGRSKLTAVARDARPGTAGSLQLTYDLDRRGWIGMQWQGEAIPGRPTAVSFWTCGDASKHLLVVRIEDAAGQTFEVRLATIDWQGWRRIDVPMNPAKWKAVRHFAETVQPVRWPVAVREIRIEKAAAQPALGSVAFSELRATSDIRSVDRLELRVKCDAPANVFYPPAPVVLQATLLNPTPRPLSGRLETLVDDWQGSERRFEDGKLEIPAGGQVTRTIRLPLADLGARIAWVQFHSGSGLREKSQHFAVSRKAPAAAQPDTASPFGMGLYLPRFQTGAEVTQALTLAREAGVKWTRSDLSPAHLAPADGRWAWDGPRWVPGHSGQAMQFSSGRPLVVPSSLSLNRPCTSGEMTLAFWVKFAGFNYKDRWKTLLNKGEGPQRQFHLYMDVPSRHLGISFGDGKSAWSDVLCMKSNWIVNRWYHVMVAHRRTERRVQWWVDEAPAGEARTQVTPTLVKNDLPLEIGLGMDFALDDLAIYDQWLTPAQLAAAHGGKETPKPLALWNFDEGQGDRAADASGNGNDGLLKPLHAEWIFAETAKAGISSYCVVMGTPAWMASKPTAGVERAWNIMPQLDRWSATVEQIATRYAQQGIHTWEIWNEPNGESFWTPQPDPKEYCQVLAASYKAIKKADPRATILGCSLAGPFGPNYRPPYEFVEEVLKCGGDQAMDAISIHPYRQPRSPENSQYVADIGAISDLTAKYGRRLPIWITEVGWPNGAGGCSEAWSAKMLVRSYLLAIAAGVKNVAWYDYHDDGPDPSYNEHNFGILRYDLTPKPAYFAYRAMATELAGMHFEREIAVRNDLSLLLFATAGRRTAVAWSHHGDISLALQAEDRSEVECVDLMGNVQRRGARDGVVLLDLTDAPVFLRNVPKSLEAIVPVTCMARTLKVPHGEAADVPIVLRNPFNKPLELSGGGQTVAIAAGGSRTVVLPIPADAVASWQPPVWQTSDGTVKFPTTVRLVALSGQRAPIFEYLKETSQPTSVPGSAGLNATDEVTIACRFRSEGPSDTWQVPVSKWQSDMTRNFGLYLGRERGELFFSASFADGANRFSDISSGTSLFDGRWRQVAVTYSKHDAELCFYVDGKLVHREPFDGGDLAANDAPISVAGGFFKTEAGKRRAWAAVRDIRVWNRALSAAEVADLKP